MVLNTAPFTLYFVVIVILLLQYVALHSVEFYKLFYHKGVGKHGGKLAICAGIAFIANVTSVLLTYAGDKGARHSDTFRTVLVLQIFYYVLQWSYVPYLVIMSKAPDDKFFTIVRNMNVLLLAVCASLQIASFSFLFNVPFDDKKIKQASIVLQGLAAAWTTGFDLVVHSMLKTSYSMPYKDTEKKSREEAGKLLQTINVPI